MKFFPRMPMPVETMPTPDVLPTIELSPERVAKALDLEHDEVLEQLHSVEGRKQLLTDLQRDPELLASAINPDSLRMFEQDMEMTEEDLRAEQRFLEAQKDPEKKGMFRRAWDTVTGFPRKHPVITVALLGVVLGVVASYMGWLPRIDFPGLWGRAQGWMGWGAAGEAAGEAAAETAGEGATALGTEVAADFVPEALKIHIFDHSFLYNGQQYTMEQLPQLLEQLPEITGDAAIKVLPYGNARVTAEMALMQALQEKGIQSELLEGMVDKVFVPNP
jgi:hypothetical protein